MPIKIFKYTKRFFNIQKVFISLYIKCPLTAVTHLYY